MNQVKIKRSGEYEHDAKDWGELTWFASGKMGNSGEMTLGKCVIRPGMQNPRHGHPDCEEVLHVLNGKIVHTAEGEDDIEMSAGDTITIPPKIVHNARNAGSEDAVLLICFSTPERKTVGE